MEEVKTTIEITNKPKRYFMKDNKDLIDAEIEFWANPIRDKVLNVIAEDHYKKIEENIFGKNDKEKYNNERRTIDS